MTTLNRQSLTPDDLMEFASMIEETIEFTCEEWNVSAEMAYLMTSQFIDAKVQKLQSLKARS